MLCGMPVATATALADRRLTPCAKTAAGAWRAATTPSNEALRVAKQTVRPLILEHRQRTHQIGHQPCDCGLECVQGERAFIPLHNRHDSVTYK